MSETKGERDKLLGEARGLKDGSSALRRRLAVAERRCSILLQDATVGRVARSRIAPILDAAYGRIADGLDAVDGACERNDPDLFLKKAKAMPTAKHVYANAYAENARRVREGIASLGKCLEAYERAIATLEVGSIEADMESDFDKALMSIRGLKEEAARECV